MDNVCHTLVGLAIARAGFTSRTSFAASTAAVAANLPDLDVLVFVTNTPSVAFRRGVTHGVPAQLLLPLACATIAWAFASRRSGNAGPPARFGPLLALSYLGVLTHVGLDLLNNYGVRLLSPFSQRWFYGDALFIVDVWLWVVLGAGILAARSTPRWAAVSLGVAGLYIAGMVLSARMARTIVREAWTARTGTPPHALMVGPVPVTPFRRAIIVDAGDRYVDGSFRWFPTAVSFDNTSTPKNEDLPGVAAARRDAQIAGILLWSRFPAWETREVPGGTEVRLRDMRFRNIGRGGFSATTVVSH